MYREPVEITSSLVISHVELAVSALTTIIIIAISNAFFAAFDEAHHFLIKACSFDRKILLVATTIHYISELSIRRPYGNFSSLRFLEKIGVKRLFSFIFTLFTNVSPVSASSSKVWCCSLCTFAIIALLNVDVVRQSSVTQQNQKINLNDL